MGTQFIHLEEYTLGRGKGGSPDISGVLKEARRVPSHCKHVERPKEPLQVYGLTPLEVEKDIVSAAKTIGIKGRAIRKDSKVVVAGIASYPEKRHEIKDMKQFERWVKATVNFLSKEFGSSFKSAIMHLDEEYPHLHFYAYEKESLKIESIHPALKAKKAEKVKRKKKQAYKKGLIEFNDRYFHDVSYWIGHKRFKDKRNRLERNEYMERKELLEEQRALREREKEVFNIKYNEKMKECEELKVAVKDLSYKNNLLKMFINKMKNKFINKSFSKIKNEIPTL